MPAASGASGQRADDADRRWPLSAISVVGSVTALTAVAVAQPLLDLLGRNAAFLVAHDATAFDVVAIAVGISLVVPLLLAGLVLAVKRARPALAAGLHAAVLFVLGTILVLVVAQLTGLAAALPGALVVAVAMAAAVAVPWAYHRSPPVRRGIVIAAVAAPAVAVLFLFASPARALFFPPPPATPVKVTDDPPPVVVVMFDELPLVSLLDERRLVDRDAFPNFARLSSESTFFRNATSVHGQTSDAVPAALDGHYPRAEALPLAADHPDNLFALLSGTYRMNVVEPLTQLCPPGVCPPVTPESSAQHYATLLRDLAIVGSHLVAPPDLAGSLPPIDQGWRDFRADAQAQGKLNAFRDRFHAERENRPTDGFDEFLAGIDGTRRPAVHFLHLLLPHSPWSYLPDGRSYTGFVARPGLDFGRWVDDEWRVAQGYQRHLLQVQFADRLLGQLLDRLEADGLYDDAVVIVLADHGASFTPGRSMRMIEPDTFGEIGAVPMFVKAPQQRHGTVSDHPVEIVDLLPTILDLIGSDAPPGLDGRSAYDNDVAPRTKKRFFDANPVLEFPAEGEEKWPILARKQRWFGTPTAFDFPYNLAPPGLHHLLGSRLPAPTEVQGAPAVVHDQQAFANVDLESDTLRLLVEGVVPPTSELGPGVAVAIGVNGRIGAVTLLEGAPDVGRFRATVPPELMREGSNEITVWRVDGAQPRLLGPPDAVRPDGGG